PVAPESTLDAIAIEINGFASIPKIYSLNDLNPGTACTTVPKPTAADVLIIAITELLAPSFIAFINTCNLWADKSRIKIIPVSNDKIIYHLNKYKVIINWFSKNYDISILVVIYVFFFLYS